VRRLVHVVSDCCAGDLSFAELVQQVGLAVGDAEVIATTVGPEDTLAAGWCVAQLALANGPPGRMVVHHVGVGERICVGRSRTGALVVGPDAGWAWSFVVHALSELCWLDVRAGGGGLDVVPVAIRHAVTRHPHAIARVVSRDEVPTVPDCVVAWIDRAGSIKTTVVEQPAPTRERVLVRVGERSATATVTDGSFDIDEGALALAPCEGPQRRFYELLLRGGSAAERFGRPPSGTPVALEPAT
jgi:hypothetical protein